MKRGILNVIITVAVIIIVSLPIYFHNISINHGIMNNLDRDFKEALTTAHGGFNKDYNNMDIQEVSEDYSKAIGGISTANNFVEYTSYSKENPKLAEAISQLNSYMIDHSPLIEPIDIEVNGMIFDRIIGITISPLSEERAEALINYIESLN